MTGESALCSRMKQVWELLTESMPICLLSLDRLGAILRESDLALESRLLDQWEWSMVIARCAAEEARAQRSHYERNE